MSGLEFSSDTAEKLIAAYQTMDMVRQRDATLQRLDLNPGERIIDIGCGPGFLSKDMAAAVGPTGCVVGIDISEDACGRNVEQLVRRAKELNSFVRVDMESSEYTERTLQLVTHLHAQHGAVGTVIQAYLRRSEQDVEMLCRRGIRVRLCKGAYLEPSEVAYQAKADVDRNFVHLMKILLAAGSYPAIATHDEKMIDETKSFARSRQIARETFEFQMLYGIRRDLQRRLVAEGYRLRLYVPFGKAWYPYFMRRLAERPANVAFLARNFFRA